MNHFAEINELTPLAEFFTCSKTNSVSRDEMTGYDGHFLQCGDRSDFWDNKQYLLDPVCIFIVLVNYVLALFFLNVLRIFAPASEKTAGTVLCRSVFFFFSCFCFIPSRHGTLD